MRFLALLLMVSVCLPFVVGCSGDKPAPEDDQFQKDLAKAEAENKGKPKKQNSLGKLPPSVTQGIKNGPPPVTTENGVSSGPAPGRAAATAGAGG